MSAIARNSRTASSAALNGVSVASFMGIAGNFHSGLGCRTFLVRGCILCFMPGMIGAGESKEVKEHGRDTIHDCEELVADNLLDIRTDPSVGVMGIFPKTDNGAV